MMMARVAPGAFQIEHPLSGKFQHYSCTSILNLYPDPPWASNGETGEHLIK